MRKLIIIGFILLLMTLPATARAAVTYDNSAGTNCTPGACTSITYSLTVGSGSNRALIVWVFISGSGNYAAAPAVTAVTYAGVSLVQISVINTTNYEAHSELWALPAGTQPTSGANNVVVTLDNQLQINSVHTGAMSVAGVD
jgi:hypothetical protein